MYITYCRLRLIAFTAIDVHRRENPVSVSFYFYLCLLSLQTINLLDLIETSEIQSSTMTKTQKKFKNTDRSVKILKIVGLSLDLIQEMPDIYEGVLRT